MRILILLFLSVNLFGQYNAGTNRNAKDFDRYLAYRFSQLDPNSEMTIFDGTITTGTSVKNSSPQTLRNSLIPQIESDYTGLSVWSFTKNVSNPLIAIAGTGTTLEFYPPLVLKEGSNWYVLGKVSNNTYGATSSDGITWTAPSLFIPIGSSGQWDDIVSSPSAFVIENGVFKAFTAGYGDSPAYNYKIGYAYNSAFTNTGWTKSPSYIYDVSDYNTKNGTTWNSIRCGDAIKVGNRWWYFGSVYNNSFDNGELCYGIGDEGGNFEDIVLDSKICSFDDVNKYYQWIANPSVIKHPTTGEYYLFLTCGDIVYNATKSNQLIYVIKSGRTDAPIFNKWGYTSYPVMVCNESLQWENNQVYCAKFVRDEEGVPLDVGGSFYMYYAAHENTASFTYSGAMCLALINSIP